MPFCAKCLTVQLVHIYNGKKKPDDKKEVENENKTRRLAAFLLSAAVVITAVPGMQERVYAQKTGGYTESPKSENVPVVQETKSRLKRQQQCRPPI